MGSDRGHRKTLMTAFLVLFLPFLSSGCFNSPEALRNQCRANMNTLSSDMALFRVTTGYWAEGVARLDSMAGRRESLKCPVCETPYEVDLHADGYFLSCPGAGHGMIDTGTPDWGSRD